MREKDRAIAAAVLNDWYEKPHILEKKYIYVTNEECRQTLHHRNNTIAEWDVSSGVLLSVNRYGIPN